MVKFIFLKLHIYFDADFRKKLYNTAYMSAGKIRSYWR